ncbi:MULTISPECIES: class C sortase [unclassified Ruminococcus]|uniref:class C sortase n=1 Tax=unclassified Ruminococcus TaxID=2608920 RepID=UPI00210B2F2E|nr:MULTISPECIES: class C sortase [unclassified Ruminococcus]MCQ4021707.1 class C sortase [Ruminococcus sp. zg-924]MCQ4114152.1 class C sortase [Ruminococcus sp. zg-921]
MNKNIIKICSYVLVALVFMFGLIIYLYPIISGYISEKNSAIVIENFENIRKSVQSDAQADDNNSGNTELSEEERKSNTAVDTTDSEKYNELYKEMQEYNYDIYKNGQKGLCDAWSYEQASVDLSEFGLYDSAVGVLRVPRMNDLNMPIYLGASGNNMSKGAAQLGETSMPIGGNNTNCVIAGHRGWNGARYFLDIEQMQIGDMVYIDNLWTTLSYEVCDIKIIQPDDIDEILIQKNKDMVTLITCHPYWASTYRYAVFCSRVSYDNNSKLQTESTADNKENEKIQQEENLYATEESDNSEKYKSSESTILIERISYIMVPIFLLVMTLVIILHRRVKMNRE